MAHDEPRSTDNGVAADGSSETESAGDESDADGAVTIEPGTDRFLLDVMLGTLAVYLRMCGYDAAYAGDRGVEADERLRAVAAAEDRRLVTRDVDLATVTDGAILLSARDVADQLTELHEAGVRLEPADEPVRCGRCNGALAPVDGGAGTPEYAPDPGQVDCWRCPDCGRVFWRGSHVERMADTIERATGRQP